MGIIINIAVTLVLTVLTIFSNIGQGDAALTRRWTDTSPFKHIKLQIETQDLKASSRGWGCFRAYGKVDGPITKEQFIVFTDMLSKEAKNRWYDAEGLQYIKGSSPLPPRGAAQLTGTGRDLYFNFLTDQKPIRDWRPGAGGHRLLLDSHDKQIRLFFPGLMKEADTLKRGARQNMELSTRLMTELQKTRLTHKGDSSQWLDRWYKSVAEKRTHHLAIHQEASQRLENLRKVTKHSFSNTCVECRLMTEAADLGRRGSLYKAWQVSFGVGLKWGGGSYWGPQRPCAGKMGYQYGCLSVQQDNGVINLYDTAFRLDRYGQRHGVTAAELMVCKRDGSGCGSKLEQLKEASLTIEKPDSEVKTHATDT